MGTWSARTNANCSIFLVGGLDSDPRHAWFFNPANSTLDPPLLHDTGRVTLGSLLSSSGSTTRLDDTAIDLNFFPQQSLDLEDAQSIMSRNEGCFWPLHLLPNDFHNARIGTYAYKSQWNSDRFAADLHECGREMLVAIHQKRTTHSVGAAECEALPQAQSP